ncbi:MAG TPA: dephospho-CoA kinase [Phycisphaerales bacterium]|nr:dephospho-CoA kinase [Phycisphaerales bacterium]
MKRVKVIGLLGGIGSGKSTVAREFARRGCPVIDADAIGHELLDAEPHRTRLVETFGEEIIGAEGRVDRRALADCAFASAEAVATLNGILHPPIRQRCQEEIGRHQAKGRGPAIVLDAPLLVEAGLADACDVLVFVECDRSRRFERWARGDRDRAAALEKRENFQISLDMKRQMADYIVGNNSGLSAITEQVARILSAL